MLSSKNDEKKTGPFSPSKKYDQEARRKNVGLSGASSNSRIQRLTLNKFNGIASAGANQNLSVKKVLAWNRDRSDSRKETSSHQESSPDRKPSLKRTLREVIMRETGSSAAGLGDLPSKKKYFALINDRPPLAERNVATFSYNYGPLSLTQNSPTCLSKSRTRSFCVKTTAECTKRHRTTDAKPPQTS